MRTSALLVSRSIVLALAVAALPALAREEPIDKAPSADEVQDGWNDVTIRPADVPRDAPRFDAYRSAVYSGPSAAARLTSGVADQMYRTRIKAWAQSKANFAGHYILATWGCGTDCLQITIIDAKTGEVFHPPGVGSIASTNVHDALLAGQPGWPTQGPAKFEVNSDLLVLVGMPEEDVTRRGISYYIWRHGQLKLVRFVPKPWYQ